MYTRTKKCLPEYIISEEKEKNFKQYFWLKHIAQGWEFVNGTTILAVLSGYTKNSAIKKQGVGRHKEFL